VPIPAVDTFPAVLPAPAGTGTAASAAAGPASTDVVASVVGVVGQILTSAGPAPVNGAVTLAVAPLIAGVARTVAPVAATAAPVLRLVTPVAAAPALRLVTGAVAPPPARKRPLPVRRP
jgi:hypothetical protein